MIGLIGVAAAALLAGCSSAPKTSDAGTGGKIFDQLQARAAEVVQAGGLAAVATGDGKSANVAMARAKERGRAELARIIESKVDTLRKDFSEEVGEGPDAKLIGEFSEVTRGLASQVLRGSVPVDIKYVQNDGYFTAWALMIQDAKIFKAALDNQVEQNKELWTRFRASKAHEELDQRVKEYEDWKQKEQDSMKEIIK